jgi:hypothetical protein
MPGGREVQLIKLGSVCEDNLYPGGPATVAEVKKQGRSRCPHFGKCNTAGAMHQVSGFQCTMLFGAQVARNMLDDGTSLDQEMRNFTGFFKGVNPRHGFISSDDRVKFTTITDKEEALSKVRQFAEQLMSGSPRQERPSVGHRDLNDVVALSVGLDGTIDARKMQALEGSCGSNGGRGCDVTEGPCSCGAWH